MKSLKIALAQINPVVGDIAHNAALIKKTAAENPACDLLVFPELALTGYPPEDLLQNPDFQQAVEKYSGDLATSSAKGPALLVGAPIVENDRIFNAALLLHDGKVQEIVRKHALPNYGVFDEQRYFTSGPLPLPVPFRGHQLGILICEDVWFPEPARHLKEKGAECLIVINASPFDTGKYKRRLICARKRIMETGLKLAYAHMFGGQDDVVFDGGSFVLNAKGELIAQAPFNREAILPVQWDAPVISEPSIDDQTVYDALVLALRDYVNKNNFPAVLLGLSGGIDSAFVACLAVDALGEERVKAYMLPSSFTSRDSLDDAAMTARNLNIQLDTIPIAEGVTALSNTIAPALSNPPSVVFENLQSRLRGTILMALSNASGAMLLTTGNKSEMATGYATLYGDMNGGFNPVKDVYKTHLYQLARSCCAGRIPDNIFTKAPTAELKPGQTDQDTLPPYEILDGILKCLLEDNLAFDEIVARGYDPETIVKIEKMLFRSEYKRRQAAPGPKITPRAFERERRYPITNGFFISTQK